MLFRFSDFSPPASQAGGGEEDRPFAELPEADFQAKLELTLEISITVTRAALEAV